MAGTVVKISSIIPNKDNPRIIKDEKFNKLVKSLKEFPEMATVRPIVVNKEMVVLGGNMRLKAMIEAGWKEAPVQVVDWPEEKQREFIIKDNVGFGEWDWDMIANEWDTEQVQEWGLDIPDFALKQEAEDDDYEIPDEVQTDIVEGDIFEIGQHRLLCGSSTQTDTWKRLMGEELADLVITDPPYNVAYEGKTKKKLTIENDSMGDGDFYQFLYDFYTALGSYTKAGGAWYVWHADSEGANFRRAMADAGIMVKQCLIWVKQTMVMGRQDYQWKHEPCLYGWKEGAAHGWYSDRKQTTVLEFDRPSRNAEHPTMKPVPLIAYQMGNSSKQGDIVCDGFGGSGTTMVAAHQLNRRCRMMELDPSLEIKKNGKLIENKQLVED